MWARGGARASEPGVSADWRARAFALRARLAFWSVAPLAWLAVVLAPGRTWSRRALRAACRTILALAGARVRVTGKDALCAPRGPFVLVSNHRSYLDVLVLTAALPLSFAFVAKAELGRSWISRWPLARIGTLFVERFDRRQGLADFRKVATETAAGSSVLFFPEGTFGPDDGLRPFHPGAFLAAVHAGAPVVPVALSGTREVLPPGSRRPRPGCLRVAIGAPLPAEGEGGAGGGPGRRGRAARARELSGQSRAFIAGQLHLRREDDAQSGQFRSR
jgi:1-acyl-sn-glycerol-3-phosphate acyltransferase